MHIWIELLVQWMTRNILMQSLVRIVFYVFISKCVCIESVVMMPISIPLWKPTKARRILLAVGFLLSSDNGDVKERRIESRLIWLPLSLRGFPQRRWNGRINYITLLIFLCLFFLLRVTPDAERWTRARRNNGMTLKTTSRRLFLFLPPPPFLQRVKGETLHQQRRRFTRLINFSHFSTLNFKVFIICPARKCDH